MQKSIIGEGGGEGVRMTPRLELRAVRPIGRGNLRCESGWTER